MFMKRITCCNSASLHTAHPYSHLTETTLRKTTIVVYPSPYKKKQEALTTSSLVCSLYATIATLCVHASSLRFVVLFLQEVKQTVL